MEWYSMRGLRGGCGDMDAACRGLVECNAFGALGHHSPSEIRLLHHAYGHAVAQAQLEHVEPMALIERDVSDHHVGVEGQVSNVREWDGDVELMVSGKRGMVRESRVCMQNHKNNLRFWSWTAQYSV